VTIITKDGGTKILMAAMPWWQQCFNHKAVIFSTSNSNTFTQQIGTCDYCLRVEALVTLQFGLTAVGVCDCAQSLQLRTTLGGSIHIVLTFRRQLWFRWNGDTLHCFGSIFYISFIRIQHKSILILTKCSQELLNNVVF